MLFALVCVSALALLLLIGGLLYINRPKNAVSATNGSLKIRPIFKVNEKKIFSWLVAAFPEYYIFAKLPITRYLRTTQRANADSWYSLLEGIYCSFAICDKDGRVIGCVDIENINLPSLRDHKVKRELLSKLGIKLWTLNSDRLPEVHLLRAAFIDKRTGSLSQDNKLNDTIDSASYNLRTTVSRQRILAVRKPIDFSPSIV